MGRSDFFGKTPIGPIGKVIRNDDFYYGKMRIFTTFTTLRSYGSVCQSRLLKWNIPSHCHGFQEILPFQLCPAMGSNLPFSRPYAGRPPRSLFLGMEEQFHLLTPKICPKNVPKMLPQPMVTGNSNPVEKKGIFWSALKSSSP